MSTTPTATLRKLLLGLAKLPDILRRASGRKKRLSWNKRFRVTGEQNTSSRSQHREKKPHLDSGTNQTGRLGARAFQRMRSIPTSCRRDAGAPRVAVSSNSEKIQALSSNPSLDSALSWNWDERGTSVHPEASAALR